MGSVVKSISAFAPVNSLVEVYFQGHGWFLASVLKHENGKIFVSLNSGAAAYELKNWFKAYQDGFIRIYGN